MTPTEARLATLRAMADYYNPKTNVGSDDVRRVVLAEIAAIEAEKAPCVPKVDVGCVVRAPSGDAVVVGLNKRYQDAASWNYVYIDGHRKGDRDHDTEVKYLRPATPAERIAAGIDKATTAKPPARPKRVRVTGNIPYPANRGTLVDGTILNVKRWSSVDDPRPLATWPDGFDRYLHEGEWVPADEPEVCEAWAVFNRFGTVMMYADNEPSARAQCDYLNGKHPDDDQQIPYRVVHLIDAELLARAKVKS
jgi:hypothetical protein